MGASLKVCAIKELPPGACRVVRAGDVELAAYNVDGTIYATGNCCPHRGGPLGEGTLDQGVVTCPWHSWQFDCATGVCLDNPRIKVPTYPVQVDGDDVLVSLPAPAPAPTPEPRSPNQQP